MGRGRRRATRVEADAVNKWLFNADTVDKVLEHLMTTAEGGGGDRLGKTIVFAKNMPCRVHPGAVRRQLSASEGRVRAVIDFKVDYAQSLIDSFSNASKAPHIAISVDMLDTGIDVPEVVNLVFFKLVRSKTKFWQMIGRGTRLCRTCWAGKDKAFFYVFDFCQNLEFFSQNVPTVDGVVGDSLTAKLFKTGWNWWRRSTRDGRLTQRAMPTWKRRCGPSSPRCCAPRSRR